MSAAWFFAVCRRKRTIERTQFDWSFAGVSVARCDSYGPRRASRASSSVNRARPSVVCAIFLSRLKAAVAQSDVLIRTRSANQTSDARVANALSTLGFHLAVRARERFDRAFGQHLIRAGTNHQFGQSVVSNQAGHDADRAALASERPALIRRVAPLFVALLFVRSTRRASAANFR